MNNIPSLNAFQAYATRQTVAANNVANVNTDGFRPSQVNLEENPEQQGVRVQEVRRNGTETQEASQAQTATRAASQPTQASQGGTGPAREDTAARQPSETDLATEMTKMMENKTAYAANAAVVKTNDQMAGELLNKMV